MISFLHPVSLFLPVSFRIQLLFLLFTLLSAVGFCGTGMEEFAAEKRQKIDAAINEAIKAGEIPGAVLWLESQGRVYQQAYGQKVKFPESAAMTLDTIFDLASLTKVLATAPSILHLYEAGRLDLNAPICQYLPEFRAGGNAELPVNVPTTAADREKITVLHLLSHQSGLPPSISLTHKEFWGEEAGLRRALAINLVESPTTRFRYSDVNYILLGEIVRRISGERVDRYAATHLFNPLGMKQTAFMPDREWLPKIAPTTFIPDYGLLRGEVHDPVCRRMGGVAGHAGLFSTAEDVARFCRIWVDPGQKIFKAETLALATRPHTPEALKAPRGLGWDISSQFAVQRGEKFPLDGFGHTGWTGTSIWIDPKSQTFVILLANRNHPQESGKIRDLRFQIGTLAAEAVGYVEKVEPLKATALDDLDRSGQTAGGTAEVVRNGIDVLQENNFAPLAGMKIGLITNHTGINNARRSTIDLLADAPNVTLKRLFSPEHGIRGTLETDSISDEIDKKTGLPIISLYKIEGRKPTPEQLADLDALVFDIQDIGCRFYTYISTMGLAMEAASENGKKFIVLDRVNPIGGVVCDGPLREGPGNDFVAFHDIPVQHGLTVGELARLFKAERGLARLELLIIPVEGWKPAMYFDQTGLPWVNPSPNIRSLTQALLYPGVGLLEFTNLSVGRGTNTPFEIVGAPWITEGRLVDRLNDEKLPGILFVPVRFTPESSVYQNEDCGGVRMIVTDRSVLKPIDVGLAIGRAVLADYSETFDLGEQGNKLLRSPETHSKWLQGQSTKTIRKDWDKPLKQFKKRTQNALIYKR
jgi:uncharacterized protein YbbC (DUF1343 family)/CubicO group peptidase (beta-lactamase class C family)